MVAQKKGLSPYAMPYLSSRAETTASEDALCSVLHGDGGKSVGRMSPQHLHGEANEKLKEDLIKKGKKEYFVTIA